MPALGAGVHDSFLPAEREDVDGLLLQACAGHDGARPGSVASLGEWNCITSGPIAFRHCMQQLVLSAFEAECPNLARWDSGCAPDSSQTD